MASQNGGPRAALGQIVGGLNEQQLERAGRRLALESDRLAYLSRRGVGDPVDGQALTTVVAYLQSRPFAERAAIHLQLLHERRPDPYSPAFYQDDLRRLLEIITVGPRAEGLTLETA
jgi:hypothetical protein